MDSTTESQEFTKALFAQEEDRVEAPPVELAPDVQKVAQHYGIVPEFADILLTAQDEATLQRQAERLVELGIGTGAPKIRRGSIVPNEGKNPKVKDSSMSTFIRNLFN